MPGINLRPTLRQKKSGSASAFLQEEASWYIGSRSERETAAGDYVKQRELRSVDTLRIENENDDENEND